MRLIKSSVCLAAALQAFACAQGAAAPQAGTPKAVEAKAKPAAAAASDASTAAYSSPFRDYRKFNAEEPLKSWRRANDEVRDAGGHVGLMKGAEGKAMDHGGHGAKPAGAGN